MSTGVIVGFALTAGAVGVFLIWSFIQMRRVDQVREEVDRRLAAADPAGGGWPDGGDSGTGGDEGGARVGGAPDSGSGPDEGAGPGTGSHGVEPGEGRARGRRP